MKRKYRVTLRIEVEGVVYEFGDIVALDLETAMAYAPALIPVEVEDQEEE